MSAPREQSLGEQARKALEAIRRYPAAFVVPMPVQSRWAEGVAHVAQALAIFADLATADVSALTRDARLGEAELAVNADDAANNLRDALAALAGPAKRFRAWKDGDDLASGAASGEKGQRLLLAIADRLRERFEYRPEVRS